MAVIEVQNLHKRYRQLTALHDVSFSVERGEIFGIVGPNGAGKTTTVECIEGLRKPDGGSVRVLGLDPQQQRDLLRRKVGVQLQSSQLAERIKVWEALDLFSSFYEQPADWQQLLELLGLAEKRNALYRELSGGQKQRLSTALALVGNPEILILDELTSGLDPQARRDIWQLIEQIRERGVTILLVTHFMEEAERLCDRIAVLDAGRVVALDSPAGIVARVNHEQRLRFRPSAPIDLQALAGLPGVHSVTRHGATLLVTGGDNLLQVVSSWLARQQVIAYELRIEQLSLDDAFVALTGRKLAQETEVLI